MNQNNLNIHTINNSETGDGNIVDLPMHTLPLRKQKLFKRAQTVALSVPEKSDGNNAFKNFMDTNQAVNTIPTKSPYLSDMGFFLKGLLSSSRQKMLVPVAAVLVFLMAAGTTYAANESLPGDTLYPVKLNINENLETLLAASAESRAKVNAAHAAERLEEAERLAAQGRLDAATQVYLASNFKLKADRVEKEASMLRGSGNVHAAAAVNSDFESSLSAHHTIIASLAAQSADDGESDSLRVIKDTVKEKLLAVMKVRSIDETRSAAEINAAGDAKIYAQKQLTLSKKNIAAAEKYILNNASQVGSEETALMRARLNVAKAVVAESQIKMEVESYTEAALLLKGAARVADETKKTVMSIATNQTAQAISNANAARTALTKKAGTAGAAATASATATVMATTSAADVPIPGSPGASSVNGASVIAAPVPAIVVPAASAAAGAAALGL